MQNGSLHLGTHRRKISNERLQQSPKSNSMRNHLRGRACLILTLFIGSCACLSCGPDRQTDSFLERHSQELVNLTVPIDSSTLVRRGVQQTTWDEKASWEFDTKMGSAEYTEWVNGKLHDRFRVTSRTDSQLRFSRNPDDDTEAITVHLAPSGGNLHVRVEVVVSPG